MKQAQANYETSKRSHPASSGCQSVPAVSASSGSPLHFPTLRLLLLLLLLLLLQPLASICNLPSVLTNAGY